MKFFLYIFFVIFSLQVAAKKQPRYKRHFEWSDASSIGKADTDSGITLQASEAETVTGIFIQHVWKSASGNCASPTDYCNASGLGYGMVWTPVVFEINDNATIGKNFLYNMMFQFLTLASMLQSAESGTPGSIGGSGSNNAWCIQLGLTSVTPNVFTPLTSGTISNNLLNASNSETSKLYITCTDPTILASGSCTATTSIQQFPKN